MQTPHVEEPWRAYVRTVVGSHLNIGRLGG